MNEAVGVLAGLRLLVAEDESLIALDLESTLTRMGCEVVGPASRVDDVLRHIRQGGINGAILDVNMRGRKIFEILPEILALPIKVILTSGYDNPTLFPEPFRDLPRISKPFDEDALIKICRTVFER